MNKNLNKVRDMKHAKYARRIRASKDVLERISLLYEDLNPVLKEDVSYMEYEGWVPNGEWMLTFVVEMSMWNEIVKNLGLIVNKEVRGKREWRIA